MTTKKVRKAVIPAAGLGTRFLPVTKAIPKEMVPIVDVPVIHYIVEEAVKSGIEDVILITARNKGSIEDYFDYSYELDDTLKQRKKDALYELSRSVASLCNLICVRQKNPLGLGHAVLTAASIVGDEPFAVLLPDDMVDAPTPCTRQLIDVYERENQSVVGVMKVPREDVSKYGIVAGREKSPRLHQVDRVVEKPSSAQAPSQLAIPGRYVLSGRIFKYLAEVKPGVGGEIQLTDGLEMLAKNEGLMAYEFSGDRYDAGDRMGYLHATLAYALKRPELRDPFLALMKRYVEKEGEKHR